MTFRIVILAIIVMLGGCAVPVSHGPYYHPIYPDMDSPDSPWLPYFGSTVQSRLRFKFNESCYMQLQASPVDQDFILGWHFERYGKNNEACHFAIGHEALTIEDLKTGSISKPESIHRIFLAPGSIKPKMDFMSGMAPYSADFSKIPAELQTYTVSIPLQLDVVEKIPASVRIRLPDILIGDQRMSIPILTLKKVETGGNIQAYVPVSALPLTNADAIVSFGMNSSWSRTSGSMAMFFAGATLWHEERGVFRIASSFNGRDDVKTSTMIKPHIRGEILIQVMSGKGVQLSASQASWMTEDGKETRQDLNKNNFGLAAYKTSLSDVSIFEEKDFGPHFIGLLSNTRPERARIKLPTIEVNGKIRPIKPIDFEYKPGGIGFAPWP